MIILNEKSSCYGCTACASICPVQCIHMEEDEEGFQYPVIKASKCIDCHKCEKVCPMLARPEPKQLQETAFIVRNKNMDTVKSSSSGGFFSALSNWVIAKQGIVCGALFSDNFSVKHCFADTQEMCVQFRGSKYVQSDLTGIFPRIESFLRKGRLVLFSGTPCQVAGLKKYLNKSYDNLILVDLVCHGVPSKLLWEEYLKIIGQHYSPKIAAINFRSKHFGYQSSAMQIDFEDGCRYIASPRTDIMLKSFFSHIALRPSCYHCKEKGLDRCSDFTIYDCWHSEDLLKKEDDDLGYTNVIVRGETATRLIEELSNELDIYEIPTERIVPLKGGMLMNSAKKHIHRDTFYQEITSRGLSNTFDAYLHVTKTDFVVERCKGFLKKTGILPRISRFKKAMKKKLSR